MIDLIHCREQIDQYLMDLPPDMCIIELDYGLESKSVDASNPNRATKRKIEDILEESNDLEDDIYDDIKRLYNEHPDQKYSTCSMEACQDSTDSTSAMSLQRVTN